MSRGLPCKLKHVFVHTHTHARGLWAYIHVASRYQPCSSFLHCRCTYAQPSVTVVTISWIRELQCDTVTSRHATSPSVVYIASAQRQQRQRCSVSAAGTHACRQVPAGHVTTSLPRPTHRPTASNRYFFAFAARRVAMCKAHRVDSADVVCHSRHTVCPCSTVEIAL